MAWKDIRSIDKKSILIRMIYITISFILSYVLIYIFINIYNPTTRDNILESGDRFVYNYTIENNLTNTIQGYFIAYTGGLLYYYSKNYNQSYVDVHPLDVFDSYYILDKAYKSDEDILILLCIIIINIISLLYLIFSLLKSYEFKEFKRRLLF